ncbi:MAG: lecithin retinol acyltransferase family protein [Nitrospiraceae bacterium]|nr:lecithin retinol acyltransferase family protein [Nitrospiraceae bacterium]
MARAEHVFVHRLGYTHHGVDVGDGTVIHYTGEVGQKANAVVRQTPIDEFAKGCALHVRAYASCDIPEVVIGRAKSRLGETKYHLVFNNCEHFATWCKTGQHKSEQVKDATAVGGGAVGSGTAVAAGIGTVSATGAAAGLSGPGIMSGLATVGGAVGGGAVTGIVVVGAVPAALTTGAMMYVLKDDPILHEAEREARRAGRVVTLAGAIGGTAASVGAVAAAGTVSGLSAAGISSGLAAVGTAVGGGMAAGVVITAAAPAVAAAALGYGTYRLWKRWRQSPGQDAPA